MPPLLLLTYVATLITIRFTRKDSEAGNSFTSTHPRQFMCATLITFKFQKYLQIKSHFLSFDFSFEQIGRK